MDNLTICNRKLLEDDIWISKSKLLVEHKPEQVESLDYRENTEKPICNVIAL